MRLKTNKLKIIIFFVSDLIKFINYPLFFNDFIANKKIMFEKKQNAKKENECL